MSIRAWARSTAAAALSGLAIVASVDRASASLSSTAGPASATYSTGTLAAPTGAAAARGACTILTSSTVVVTWTQTTSTFADGYEILRSTIDDRLPLRRVAAGQRRGQQLFRVSS